MSLSILAKLLEYPGPNYHAQLRDCLETGHQSALAEFAAKVEGLPVEAVQELYTQTFDWNPETTLDIGWHLFGENYDRGDFLVKMRESLRQYGVNESGELPDHLSHVLALVDRMDPDECAGFVRTSLMPALDKLSSGLQKTESPFLPLVQAIRGQIEEILTRTPSGAAHA